MIVSISKQVYIFLCTIVGGMAIALLYDVFRIFRRMIRSGRLSTFLQDCLFWAISTVIMFVTVYYSSEGELRIYQFIGAILGIVLYAMLLSRIVMGSSLFILNIIRRILKFIFNIVLFPVRLVLRVLSRLLSKLLPQLLIRPAHRGLRFTGKALKKAWNRILRLYKKDFFG